MSKTSAIPTQVTSKTKLRTRELIKSFEKLKEMLEESENPVSCDYYNVPDLNRIHIHQHDLSIIHLKISSLVSHIHELELFLSLFIVCISESRISKRSHSTINISISGYNSEHTSSVLWTDLGQTLKFQVKKRILIPSASDKVLSFKQKKNLHSPVYPFLKIYNYKKGLYE